MANAWVIGTVLGETDKAVRVHMMGVDEPQWLPKSQMSNVTIKDGRIDAEVPAWLWDKFPRAMLSRARPATFAIDSEPAKRLLAHLDAKGRAA